MTRESEALREKIRSGEIQPEANRDQEKRDPSSYWEWAVERVYEIERAAEADAVRGSVPAAVHGDV